MTSHHVLRQCLRKCQVIPGLASNLARSRISAGRCPVWGRLQVSEQGDRQLLGRRVAHSFS
jgi:hypothetical protein